MPVTATITAFYSFTPNTKARANQVENNFSLFRGHIIPIDPNTQTAINNTYDLGSAEYYWSNGYIKTLYRAPTSATTTAGVNGFAASSYVVANVQNTATAQHIANSTCTLQTIGRPVLLKFFYDSTPGAYVGGGQAATQLIWGIIRDGTTITTHDYTPTAINLTFEIGGVGGYDFPAAGSHAYSAYVRTVSYTTTSQFSYAFRLGAIEL